MFFIADTGLAQTQQTAVGERTLMLLLVTCWSGSWVFWGGGCWRGGGKQEL